jgi:hypothetical protein
LQRSYGPPKDPDQMEITLGIIRRLQGDEAGHEFLMQNLDLPEFRKIATEAAINQQDYNLAEKLCQEAVVQEPEGFYFKASPWLYFLEKIYEATERTQELTAMVRKILFKGETAYFGKLKALYQAQEIWEREEAPLWRELAAKTGIQFYSDLLEREGEMERLLEAVRQCPSNIVVYGKKLAAQYPEATFQIYENYISEAAAAANDRRKYKGVCSLLKNLAAAGGITMALELIRNFTTRYPRRPAMLDELSKLGKKLTKSMNGIEK